MTNLFPRAFQAEDWQSWGGWDPAAHPDCSAPPGIHRSIPASLPSSLTLLARASASNTAHSRATWALSCLFALHIDRHFLFTFKPLVVRPEKRLPTESPQYGYFDDLKSWRRDFLKFILSYNFWKTPFYKKFTTPYHLKWKGGCLCTLLLYS